MLPTKVGKPIRFMRKLLLVKHLPKPYRFNEPDASENSFVNLLYEDRISAAELSYRQFRR
jgi:hypothetical protein